METIKNIIDKYRIGHVVVIGFIMFSIGLVCYWAGYHAGERNVDVERVQSVERQLESARSELNEATRTNQSARELTADSVVINDRIEQRIDSIETAVSRSEEANTRTSAAVEEAQRIITAAKSTATESERIASDSKSILERAKRRTEEKTSAR